MPLGVFVFAGLHVPFGHAVDAFFEWKLWGVADGEEFVGLELGFGFEHFFNSGCGDREVFTGEFDDDVEGETDEHAQGVGDGWGWFFAQARADMVGDFGAGEVWFVDEVEDFEGFDGAVWFIVFEACEEQCRVDDVFDIAE